MNFFKENHSECQIVPSFPSGDGGIESGQYRAKTVHPGVGAFNHEPFLIKFIIEQIILNITAIGTDVCDDFMTLQCKSEGLGVKSGIGIVEKTVRAQTALSDLLSEFIDPLFNLIKICMVAFLRLGHRQRQPLSVAEIQGIGCFTSLIFNILSAFQRRRMGTVDMSHGHVESVFILPDKGGEHGLPLAESAPFSEMMVDCIPAQHYITEEMTNRKLMPLAPAFELMENRIDDLDKTALRDISSFCYAEIGHYFFFYCIFVEYSVFRHWFGKLKRRNSNIANFSRSALYFYILKDFLCF